MHVPHFKCGIKHTFETMVSLIILPESYSTIAQDKEGLKAL